MTSGSFSPLWIVAFALWLWSSLVNAGTGNDTGPLDLIPGETVIVTPAFPSPQVKNAASLLNKWLRKAAGTDDGFGIAPAGSTAAQNAATEIVLDDPLDRGQHTLPPDGFILKRNGNKIYLSGKNDTGTFFGAVELLDRLGIRFYMPTDLFTSLPKEGLLQVGDLDVVSAPWVQSLYFSGINVDDAPAAAWARINGVWRRKGGTHQHNSFAMFPPERYAARWPEIYPIRKGERYIPKTDRDQSWQPNYAEPRLVEAALQSIDLHFQKYPNDAYVALAGQDGNAYDEGPQTAAVIEEFRKTGVTRFKERAISSLYWKFMAEVALKMKETWPDKLLVGLAYGSTRYPPTQKLPENVLVFTNFHIAELPADRFLEAENKGEPTLRAWLNVTSHYGNHDWYQGSGYFIPRSYTGYWSKFLRQAQNQGGGTFMHVETYPNWGFDGPKYYMLSRLMWNPQADPETLMARMCRDLFGLGDEAMNRYFTLLDQLWNQLNFKEDRERKLGAYRAQGMTSPASRAMIVQARELLNEAFAKAARPEEKARIALFSDCFRISEYFFEFAQSRSLNKAQLEESLEFCRTTLEKHGALVAHHPHNLIPALTAAARPALRKTSSSKDLAKAGSH